jgi:hypothetical protein
MLHLVKTVSISFRLHFFSVVSVSEIQIRPNGQAPGLLFFATSLGG